MSLKSLPIFFLSLSLILTQSGFSKKPKEYKISSLNYEYFPNSEPSKLYKLRYRLLHFLNPKENEKFPLLMLLHGDGESGEDYIGRWKGIATKHRLMLAAPNIDRLVQGGAKDVGEYTELIRSLMNQYPIDPDRVYILGMSSGSIVERWIVQDQPKFWKKAVSVGTQTYEWWMKGKDLSGLPPFLFIHGEQDNPQSSSIEQYVGWIRESHGKADLVIASNTGHEYKSEWNEMILDWLLYGTVPPEKI